VTPFRQDLAKYAAQSEHLDGENSKKARELQELHMQLAGTMGHQNQKQKIKYVVRIFSQSDNLHYVVRKISLSKLYLLAYFFSIIYYLAKNFFRPKSRRSFKKQKRSCPQKIAS